VVVEFRRKSGISLFPFWVEIATRVNRKSVLRNGISIMSGVKELLLPNSRKRVMAVQALYLVWNKFH
jgi:hypothetical protein